MDDKCIMENLLLTTKGVIDLYMHGAIESSTNNVHQTFSSAFDDALSIQDNIYKQMTAKGWYQTSNAPQQDIQQVRQKFTPTC
ncbi:MAG: spore coat protein [Clostridiales bacterium]|nr:spore coat protein [Oscillospiraceae bacterium]MCD8007974.1 spore coat protein [Clostridiales bacterium]MCD8117696.1 spore coat protein [Oscillospiraceae bacterium]